MMVGRGVRLCMSVLLVSVAIAAGPAARSESLTEAMVQAYQNNPQLLAQRAQLRAVDEGVPQALSGFRPTVTARGSAGKARTSGQTGFAGSGGTSTRSPRSLSLGVEQPIFRGLRTFAETRQAENTVRAERARLVGVEQTVLFSAATVFMDVVRDQAVLELNVNNEQVLRRQLEATRDRFEVGEVTRTDVSQAEARVARANADRVRAEGNLEISRAAYRNVIGTSPGKLDTPEKLLQMPANLDEAVGIAVDGSPSVIAAEYDEKASRDGVDSATGQLLPTITLNGDLSRNLDSSSSGSRSNSASIIAQLNVPLYQAGAVTSRVREAKQVVFQRRALIAQARRDASESAKSAWETLVTARAQIRAFEAAVRANEIALEGVQQEAAAGLRTVLDVLDAEQELLDSRVSLVGAQRDEVVAGFQLWSAIGWLTAERLALPAPLYDVNEHYDDVRLKPWGLGGSLSDKK